MDTPERVRLDGKTGTELEEFRRWCRGANNPVAADAVDRWLNMNPYAKARLRRKWREEDRKK